MTDSYPTQKAPLRQAFEALQSNQPDVAANHCREQLAVDPSNPEALQLLGHALIRQRKFEEAIPVLEQVAEQNPEDPAAHKHLGQALAAVGRGHEADDAFRVFFKKDPDSGAVAVGAEHIREGNEQEAIKCFRQALKANPDNVDALRFLAAVFLKQEKNIGDAIALLERATQLAPDFASAWFDLGIAYSRRAQRMESIEAFRKAAELEPRNGGAWEKLASANANAGYPEEAKEAFEKAIECAPLAPGFHMGYGHVLKTLGDQPASLRAYREAIRLKPDFGEVYWSMANLKIFEFEDEEIEAMEHQLENAELRDETEVHFRFALGQAYEDRKDYDNAWTYYHSGNELQRPLVQYDPVSNNIRLEKIRSYFSREMLDETEGHGYPDEGPIFIVGLGRSGSTLIEQILASHSQVEGTEELSVLGRLSDSVGHYRPDDEQFPAGLDTMRPHDWRALGLEYLEGAQRFRLTDKPIFTDKLPNNFRFIGFLHLILPNATIINARRHPLDSCLGNYKQLFGHGQNWTYDIFDIGEYYSDYIKTMNHWHEVLPGKVLDVHYEETVTDLEGQVHRILEHCELPFEEQCLRFYETKRAVKTASSEQVRQPIYTGGMGKWRQYEKHLDEWIKILGPIIDDLPDVVKNAGL